MIGGTLRLLVLPIMLCVAFFLIADMDSPRRGVIRVLPQNLLSLAQVYEWRIDPPRVFIGSMGFLLARESSQCGESPRPVVLAGKGGWD